MSKKKSATAPTLFGYSIFHPLNLILLLNCLVFLMQLSENLTMTYLFALTPNLFFSGSYWQIFTYGFLHSTYFEIFPFHIMMNMYGFYMLGRYIEPIIGKAKLVTLYFLAQLGGGLFIIGNAMIMKYIVMPENLDMLLKVPTIGASGAVFGMLAVFGLLFPEEELIFIILPIKAKNAVFFSLVIGFLLEFFYAAPISNLGHLGGSVVGFLFYYLVIRKTDQKIVFKITLTRDDLEKIIDPKKEPFKDQIAQNIKIRESMKRTLSFREKVEYLQPYQIPNANICTPATYNTEDEFCLRCEWFGNCMLRKTKMENENL